MWYQVPGTLVIDEFRTVAPLKRHATKPAKTSWHLVLQILKNNGSTKASKNPPTWYEVW